MTLSESDKIALRLLRQKANTPPAPKVKKKTVKLTPDRPYSYYLGNHKPTNPELAAPATAKPKLTKGESHRYRLTNQRLNSRGFVTTTRIYTKKTGYLLRVKEA